MTGGDRGRSTAWSIVEDGLDPERLGWSESVFALANGHVGLRGNLDEGEPHDAPGTYVNSVFEQRPLPVAEPGYGMPESGQTVLNVTDGKILRILVDDEPFDVRYGTLQEHRRWLDLRDGLLERRVAWTSPAGQAVKVRSTRLVSASQRAIAAVRLTIEAVGDAARVVVQSELVTGEPQPRPDVADPRVAAALDRPLEPVDHSCRGDRVVLVHRTRRSRIGVAAAMGHEVRGPGEVDVDCDSGDDLGRATITAVLEPGEVLEVVKYVGYGWSTVRSDQALRDQVTAAVDAARHTGWDGLVEEQRQQLAAFWDAADIEVDAGDEVQAAIRFCLFHAYQSAVRAEGRPIAAKGLTGSGYDGHAFWDADAFVLPFLSHAVPRAAADAIRWRHSTLPVARARAAAIRLEGAAFAWRTIDGSECSGYWPAGTAAFHVTAAVATAARRYVETTGDRGFEATVGLDLLVEAARMLHSLGHVDPMGEFRIDGVTGPDEYSAVADNNLYTNLMARDVLRSAVDAARRHPERRADLGTGDEELERWCRAADAVRLPYDGRLGVHQQADGFTDHERWPFETTTAEEYPLFRYHPYFDLYRRQVVKQADLVLAIQCCPEAFDEEQARRDFDHYEPLTVRDSSLSAISQAVVAARLGYEDLAHAYLRELLFLDLDDLHGNVRDGVHIAACAGVWTVVAQGLAGLRPGPSLRFVPVGPGPLGRVRFRTRSGSSVIAVDLRPDRVGYTLVQGAPVEVQHHDDRIEVGTSTTWRPVNPPPRTSAPSQPPGRQPPLPAASPRRWAAGPAPGPGGHDRTAAGDRGPVADDAAGDRGQRA